MPKPMKNFQHAKQRKERDAGKYDWPLLLSGQHVLMEKGADYEPVGKKKDGSTFDRTDMVIRTISTKAAQQNKRVNVTLVNAQCKPDTVNVAGFVVQAREMTAGELAAREKRRAARHSNSANDEADDSGEDANGEMPEEAAAGVAPE